MFEGEKSHRKEYEETKEKKKKAEESRDYQTEKLEEVEKEYRELTREQTEKVSKMFLLTLKKCFRTVRRMVARDDIEEAEQELQKLKKEARGDAEELDERHEELKRKLNKLKEVTKDFKESKRKHGDEEGYSGLYRTSVASEEVSVGDGENLLMNEEIIEAYNELAQELIRFEIEELGAMPVDREGEKEEPSN